MDKAPDARKVSATALAFAAQIRAERAAKGWTQDDLAKRAGIGAKTLLRIENGQTVGNVSQVADICQALGLTFVEFARRAEVRARFDAEEESNRRTGG